MKSIPGKKMSNVFNLQDIYTNENISNIFRVAGDSEKLFLFSVEMRKSNKLLSFKEALKNI